MHWSNLFVTLTFTLLGITATASPTPMEQAQQTTQMALDTQFQQELQELLSTQGIQGERCLRTCYPQKPICNGAGAVRIHALTMLDLLCE
ncbi:hypothetical protein EMCG_03303 [[Emmonsia] crescens]|uniref:Extracellular membrane protein CFEM domain-containing protein n=1 Tax=[Emmonsia] crescens TaxID=73230 RepID=A0A0G2HWK1_9EURO|nr:hypothetical protein EMCG_03303 [Emmonsia crescens UAMH 3008]